MKVEYTRFGLKHDYRGAHVTLPYRGRILIGTVVDGYRDQTTGGVRFKVQHFNGEPWPLDPVALSVDVLPREMTDWESRYIPAHVAEKIKESEARK